MKKIVLAALLASVLVFTVVSIGKSQSAEEMAKGQSAGIKYVKPYSDECMRGKLIIEIRGNEVTDADFLEWATRACTAQNHPVGTLHKYSVNRVAKQYMDGNKLILDLASDLPWGLTRVIIEGSEATKCDKQNKCYGGFMREK